MTQAIKTIKMIHHVGTFAEDKDKAKELRQNVLWPRIRDGLITEIDFARVEDATQSFIHALLSELIRDTHGQALDLLYFKNCNETVKNIITIVVDYMQGN